MALVSNGEDWVSRHILEGTIQTYLNYHIWGRQMMLSLFWLHFTEYSLPASQLMLRNCPYFIRRELNNSNQCVVDRFHRLWCTNFVPTFGLHDNRQPMLNLCWCSAMLATATYFGTPAHIFDSLPHGGGVNLFFKNHTCKVFKNSKCKFKKTTGCSAHFYCFWSYSTDQIVTFIGL